ncbi:hypothetical protein C8R43DRAFT_512671 [Mycena crocata]|nr:hypothetical protein C8R43DRAFT_512671 [Mycena crocata]
MDVDPLADTVPPRHAIESDEEEDEYNPLQTSSSRTAPIDVQLVGDLKPVPVSGLLVATGDVGKYWARGADLGEQIAAVMVDKIQVGLLFRPSWTQIVVLVSEVTARLPLAAMHTYARTVLETLQPSNVALLDTYGVPAYIAETRITYPEAPLRYLSTAPPISALTSAAQPFAPPNLVQSVSAAFVAIQAERAVAVATKTATLLLVPASHIAPPAPRSLEPSNFAHLAESPAPWGPVLVRAAHAALFAVLGEDKTHAWTEPTPEKPQAAAQRKRPAEDDAGMYI